MFGADEGELAENYHTKLQCLDKRENSYNKTNGECVKTAQTTKTLHLKGSLNSYMKV